MNTFVVFDLLKGMVSSSEDWTPKGEEILSCLSELFSQIEDHNYWEAARNSWMESTLKTWISKQNIFGPKKSKMPNDLVP